MNTITKTFLTGLATLLPVILTFYVIYGVVISLERALGNLLALILAEGYYRPGMGIGLGIVIILIVGVMMRSWLAQNLFRIWQNFLFRVPIVKSIYGTLQDFLHHFARSEQRAEQLVVSMQVKGSNVRLIGFVTRTDFKGMPDDLGEHDSVAVYFPLSYMLGGFTVLVPRSDLTPLNMSVDAALRFAMTAGLSVESKDPHRNS